MANIIDYLKWRGDLLFTQDPPNEVDALIFSSLAYIRYEGRVLNHPEEPITLREAAEEFFELEDTEKRCRSKNDLELLRVAAESARFGFSKICAYRDLLIPEQATQFAAETFLLDDDSMYIAFRGTDNTLVGWKEDFNMSYRQTVPAQLLAVDYVRDIYAEYTKPMRLCGHSKGGNLAVFAAARSSPMIQEWILSVNNNDGPGFSDYLMGDPGYLAMVPRIHTFVPQSSIIGMILEHEEEFTIVKSTQISILQHDGYTWELIGKTFHTMDEFTSDSKFLNRTIKNWLSGMTNDERNRMVETLFDLLSTGGVNAAGDIFQLRNLRNYIKTIGANEAARQILSGDLAELLDAAKRAHREPEQKSLEE